MANILIGEPVEETRELLERLVNRMGHDIVGIDEVDSIDVLLFEPGSPAARALAERVLESSPNARLVACSAEPPRGAAPMPRIAAWLLQPFSPDDLARALAACGITPASLPLDGTSASEHA